MIPNILDAVASKLVKPDLNDLTPEELEAQRKSENRAFHRDKVRNGPVSWKSLTAGQERRARARAEARQVRKNFRAEVKNYFEKQRLASFVRAHLQNVGVIPFIDGREADIADQIRSTAWLVQRFGEEVKVDGVGTGHVSFREGDIVDAFRVAAKFYNTATGHGITVPAGFVPPISVAEDQA